MREEMRKIHLTGGKYSYTLNIPGYLIKGLGWRYNQKVVLKRQGNGILITDWEPKKKK